LAARALAHHGDAQVRATLPLVGERTVTVDVNWQGDGPPGRWDTQARLTARGVDWRTVDANIEASRLVMGHDQHTVDLTGLAAQIEADWPRFELTELTLPGTVTHGEGRFDAESLDWSADLAAQQWRIEELGDRAVDVAIEARG